MVLIFIDLYEAQISKMPCRDSPQHEVEKVMSFICLNMFKPNEDTVDFFLLENETIIFSYLKLRIEKIFMKEKI